jgi:hypothetical protein
MKQNETSGIFALVMASLEKLAGRESDKPLGDQEEHLCIP